MKILITGATGLVGQAIVEESLKRNYTVNYLTTRKSKVTSKEGYQGFYWNPNTNEIDIKAFDDVTAIINLAGAPVAKKWTSKHKKTILESRIKSLTTLKKGLEQVEVPSLKIIVSASAIGIYPNSQNKFFDEDEQELDNSFLGEVVKQWEEAVDAFEVFGLQIAKIRIGIVLAKNRGALAKIVPPIRNYAGTIFGDGEQWQSWIHIADLSRIFLFVVEKQLSGIYNGVAPNPITHKKMTKEIAKVVNRPILLPNIPKAILKLLLGEMAYILLASQRVSSKKIEAEGFAFYYSNFHNAVSQLLGNTKNGATSSNNFSSEYI